MAETGGFLKTVATLVAVIGGTIGIYKALRPDAEPALVQAVEGAITKMHVPPEDVNNPHNVASPYSLHITVQNLGKQDASYVGINAAPDEKLLLGTHPLIVLRPGEKATFEWLVPARMEKEAWGPWKSVNPRSRHPAFAYAETHGSIKWQDRITKKSGESDWCFVVHPALGEGFEIRVSGP